MKRIHLLISETSFATLKWSGPTRTPAYIEHSIQCYLVCGNKTYLSRHADILSGETTTLNVTDLKPGSLCENRFRAVYNSARLDRGMTYVFQTLHASKLFTIYKYVYMHTRINIFLHGV